MFLNHFQKCVNLLGCVFPFVRNFILLFAHPIEIDLWMNSRLPRTQKTLQYVHRMHTNIVGVSEKIPNNILVLSENSFVKFPFFWIHLNLNIFKVTGRKFQTFVKL